MLVQQGRGRGEEAVRRHVHALALDGLDDEGGDVSAAEFGGEGVEVAEGDGVSGSSGSKPRRNSAEPLMDSDPVVSPWKAWSQ